MIDLLARWACIALSPIVIGACVCRLDALRPPQTRLAWSLMYFVLGVSAAGALVESAHNVRIGWYVPLAEVGLLLHFWLTWRAWAKRPPPETDAGALRKADGSAL